MQVWVYGNSFETCVVAIVVPDQEVLMAWAEKEGIKGTFSEVCCSPPLALKIMNGYISHWRNQACVCGEGDMSTSFCEQFYDQFFFAGRRSVMRQVQGLGSRV